MITIDIEKHRAQLQTAQQNLQAEIQRLQAQTQQAQANLYATQGALQLLDLAVAESMKSSEAKPEVSDPAPAQKPN
jgi:uncharacterized Zn finger protein